MTRDEMTPWERDAYEEGYRAGIEAAVLVTNTQTIDSRFLDTANAMIYRAAPSPRPPPRTARPADGAIRHLRVLNRGQDTPHHHDDVDVLRWRQRTGQVALPDPGEVPLRCCVPHPTLEGYFCSWALAHGGDNHVWWRFTPTGTELSWREALNRSRVDSPLAQEPAHVMEPDRQVPCVWARHWRAGRHRLRRGQGFREPAPTAAPKAPERDGLAGSGAVFCDPTTLSESQLRDTIGACLEHLNRRFPPKAPERGAP